MAEQQRGSIVFVSSTVTDGPPTPGMAAHGTAKATPNTFARFLACEAGPPRVPALDGDQGSAYLVGKGMNGRGQRSKASPSTRKPAGRS
ncbi:hypothetical protein ACFOZ0_30460 [Streptomyces yaanensis]|uniref:Uncharacterized protein n=2 Tax=Streptomyces TaxID=1883 RepID=A0ABV7SM26_9ACTN